MKDERYRTETGKDVTKRIEIGLTHFFELESCYTIGEAWYFANQINSYAYEVYQYGLIVGYGVPK